MKQKTLNNLFGLILLIGAFLFSPISFAAEVCDCNCGGEVQYCIESDQVLDQEGEKTYTSCQELNDDNPVADCGAYSNCSKRTSACPGSEPAFRFQL